MICAGEKMVVGFCKDQSIETQGRSSLETCPMDRNTVMEEVLEKGDKEIQTSSQDLQEQRTFGSSIFRRVLKIVVFATDENTSLSAMLQLLTSNIFIHKTVYINLQNMDMANGLFVVDHYFMQFSQKRREEKNDKKGEMDYYEMIIAENSDENGNKKRMAVLTAKSVESELVEMDCSGMRENVIIDLSREGRRWEGGELNGKPFGFGREYSENDNLVYEGFVFEGTKVCVGKEWNDDGNNNCLMYEGGYCNGERCGKGISYDLTGNVDFEGEWINNHIMNEDEKVKIENELVVLMWIEEFVIGNDMFNDENITSLHFSPLLVRLKRIEIGIECFENVREFVIDGMESLESVNIGDECFRIDYKRRDDRLCRITNCPNPRQLEIGWNCFYDFKSFELSNVNSLQSIYFGNYGCFHYADLSLKGE